MSTSNKLTFPPIIEWFLPHILYLFVLYRIYRIAKLATSLEGSKVFYSEDVNANIDADSWKETSENAKSYKVVLPNNELKSGEKI